MSRTTDSPRWCADCHKWGDHHTDRHPADLYTAGLEKQGRSVVAASRVNLQELDRLKDHVAELVLQRDEANERANHNLQQYQKARDQLEVALDALKLISDMPLDGDYDYDAGYSESNAADAALATIKRMNEHEWRRRGWLA